MGRGTGSRHSKNAGTMGCESLTYEERRAIGWGTVKERLGKDSIKDWDSCALCLHPVQDAVCTPEGVLYEKEMILECLLQQKKDIAKKLAIWQQQEQDDALAGERRKATDDQAHLAEFHRLNHGAGRYQETALAAAALAGAGGAGGGAGAAQGALAVQATEFAKKQIGEMKAFWLPYKTPEAESKKDKPDTETKCPQTGKKLRMKDLIPVKFTKVPHTDDGNRRERFMCPLCSETFTNYSQIVLLRPTGDVIGEECYKLLVEPDGAR